MLKEMFKKTYTKIGAHVGKDKAPQIPEGLWRKCKKCQAPIYVDDVRSNYYACPKCDGYFRVSAYRRIEMITDEGSFEEWNISMPISNPLEFPNYEEKLRQAKEKSKLDEALVIGSARIKGLDVVIGICDSRFMMGSMGYNLGEKLTLAIEKAIEKKLPLIVYTCSGGARMQEGIVSLMQMAKTSAALKRLHEAGQVYISVLTDPTTGGVMASFAMLGDVILAEPKALVGFAGPRVIAQTIGAKLPEGFQRSEFLLEHGFVDKIVERKDQRDTLYNIINLYRRNSSLDKSVVFEAFNEEIKEEVKKTAWEQVLISRDIMRPTAKDYIENLFDSFIELHGDRLSTDDGAIIGGIAEFCGIPVTVIGQQKGRNIKENKIRNFGMPSPGGYRKALRLMRQANDFGRPIICFVDTPGAFCGIEAEENGQGEAIARNLFEMSDMKVPILSIVIGEGGSGGALALAVSNEVWMLENSIYSILSPEGFASILYKDSKKCKEAANDMKITAAELKELGIIDKIIKEDNPATIEDMQKLLATMKEDIYHFLDKYKNMQASTIAKQRYDRYRVF